MKSIMHQWRSREQNFRAAGAVTSDWSHEMLTVLLA